MVVFNGLVLFAIELEGDQIHSVKLSNKDEWSRHKQLVWKQKSGELLSFPGNIIRGIY